MIEPGTRPAECSVTLFTLGAELSAMAFSVIVLAVTGIALARSFFIVLGCMTRLAFGFAMPPNQWKASLAVVKPDFFPTLCNMAIVTRLTETALVLIIFTMTGVTVCWR